MPISTKIWKLNGNKTFELNEAGFELEARLEELVFNNFEIISKDWLLIGRQVYTGFGFIDLLAMDRNGNLVILELKKDRTPREVIAQLLDYGSWVQNLKDTNVSELYLQFREKYLISEEQMSLDEKFEAYFGLKLPQAINTEHELVVVASSMDSSSERIVDYLAAYHEVKINFVLVKSFSDQNSKFVSRSWHIDPIAVVEKKLESASSKWNQNYYVSFGDGQSRSWKDAVKYGFISAGGGDWYTQTLYMLQPGDIIWVNIPKVGYVGKGRVSGTVSPLSEANIIVDGKSQKLKDLKLHAPNMLHDMSDIHLMEHIVPVDWEVTYPADQAISEVGFFGNQNTVCRPVSPKWNHTVGRLEKLLHGNKKVA